ncbi:hypothetical protein RDABS01_005664 [Bienertia sinuspersici]
MEHLENWDDFEAFRKVCSVWRCAIEDVKYFCPLINTQLPWLMLVDPPESSHRRFYSLTKCMYRTINLPQLDKDDEDDHRMYYSSKGWLISVSRRNRNITLFNPFSGKVIKPPSIALEFVESVHRYNDPWDDDDYLCHFYKFIVSVNSSTSNDFAVAMVFDKTQKLAFWKPGQQEWTKPVIPGLTIDWVLDVCFFKGEFYAIDHHGIVVSFGSKPRIIANLGHVAQGQGLIPIAISNLYIVEVENMLLVIHRRVDNGDVYHETDLLETFELNVDDGKAKRVESVGNRALFVGLSSTFFVSASEHGCKANTIYFTDDDCDGFRTKTYRGGSDMGIYCLKEGKIIDRFYQGPSQFCHISPPMWVELPHC